MQKLQVNKIYIYIHRQNMITVFQKICSEARRQTVLNFNKEKKGISVLFFFFG